jgi:hypothetical protein
MRGPENKSHEPKLSRLHAQDEEIWTPEGGPFYKLWCPTTCKPIDGGFHDIVEELLTLHIHLS